MQNNYGSVAVGPTGTFYGGWKAGNFLKFATYSGTSWTELTTASFTGAQVGTALGSSLDGIVDWGPESIAVDSAGNIHVVFAVGASAGGAESLRGLAYGKYTASSQTWAFRKLFILQHPSGFRNVGNGQYSLKLDASQNPHIAFIWSDASDDPIREARLQYAYFNGTAWNVSGDTNAMDAIQIDISDGSNQEGVSHPDITFDSAGKLHCAYVKERDDKITADLWYAVKPAASDAFGTPVKVADVGNARMASIVTDASNLVSIGDWMTSGTTVTYRVTSNASGSWVTSSVATYAYPGSTAIAASYPILKINAAGRRVMALTVSPSNGTARLPRSVRLAYETSAGTWMQETAFTDSADQNITRPAMALRSDNTIMALFGRANVTGTGTDTRNEYYVSGIPTDFTGTGTVTPTLSIDNVSANEGNSGTTSFKFTATLSSAAPTGGVTFNYATAAGTATAGSDYTSASGTGTIAAGGTSTTITVLVNGDTAFESNETFLVNLSSPTNATITDSQGVGTIINDDSASADLSITATDGVTTAAAGGGVTYTITASNAGPNAVTGASLVDTFPASLSVSWSAVGAGGGSVTTTSGSGNINQLVNLPVGGSVTFTVNATISAAATGTLSNTATIATPIGVNDPTPDNNSATDSDTLSLNADLTITVTDGVTTATPGGGVTYTITASNAGPSNVTGATVADTFPAALTGTWTAVGAGGGTASAASGSGNINQSVNLPSGGSVTFTFAATISASASGTLANTATITAPAGATDPTPGNNSATDTDTLAASAIFGITVTDGVTTATPGGSVTYTITASNAGPSNATGVTVADTFPASVTASWTALGSGGGTASAASGSGNINQLVNLPAGGSVTFTINATISASATGTLSNTATITAPAGVTDPTPGNNNATDSDTLSPGADLAVTITDGVTSATSGGGVIYTITASNAGPSNVTGATLANAFPAALTGTWTAVGAGGGTATAAGSGSISQLVNLPAGGSVTFTVNATISPSATGTLANTATITAPAGVTDATPGNNSATDTDTLISQTDLALVMFDSPDPVNAGSNLTHTITVTNSGPSDAFTVTLSDPLPAGTTFVSLSTPGGWSATTPAVGGTGTISASIASVASGASATFTLVTKVDFVANGTVLSNTVSIGSANTDPVPDNNSATTSTTVSAIPEISVFDGTGSADPALASGQPTPVDFGSTTAGNPLNHTFTVKNTGTGELTVSSVTPPAGFSLVAPFTGRTLAPTASLSFVVRYNAPAVGSSSGSVLIASDDSDESSFAIPVTGTRTNAAPLATAQATVTNEDVAKAITLAGTDADGNALTYLVATAPAHGTLSGTAPNLTYTPALNYNGADSFTFTVNDSAVSSVPATVTLAIDAVNDLPVANAQTLSTNEDTALSITLGGSDVENSALSYTITTAPAHGALSGTAPNLTYTPVLNYNGPDSFSFKVNDGTADSAAAADIAITVNPVNDAPAAAGQSLATDEDTAKTITLAGSDVDAGTVLVYSVVTPPVHGALSGTAPNLTYTPTPNYNGPDSFTFKVNDGTVDSAPATISITVNAVNDPPVANAQTLSTNEDTALGITLGGSDIENSPLTYTVTTSPAHGTLSGTAPNLTYTPALNYNGPDSFAFKSNDGTADSATAATISITVNAVNDAPVANGQTLATDEDTALTVTLTGSDVDAATVLTYTTVVAPAHGTLSGTAPNLIYTPALNYNGPDSFTFKANDGTVDSATAATVAITVNAVNDAPTIATNLPDVVQTTPGNTTVIDLAPYFADVETAAASLSYTVAAAPGAPFFTTSITGTTLTIVSSGSGVTDLTVTATDPAQAGVSDTFQFTVKSVPQIAAGGIPDTVVSPAAPDQVVQLANYFSDADDDALTYVILSSSDPSKASATITGSSISLHPLAPGDTTLTIRATDIDGNHVDDSFVVTVENPIPVLTPTPGATPRLNPQTGFYEISVTAVNNNQFDIPGFRFIVTSPLPAGMTLHNSTGPAGEYQPYLDVLTRTSPGQSLVVVLEFHSTTRDFTGFNPVIVAEPLPAGLDDTATGNGSGTIQITRINVNADRGILLEFTSVAGHFYQMEYSSDLVTWKRSLVPIEAGANRVQWIDRGAPYTDSHPSTAPKRFYRVREIAR